MAQRLIGIDTDGGSWQIAVLQTEKGRTRLLHVGEHPSGDGSSLRNTLETLLAGPLQSSDRLCTSLPTRYGWMRRLHFPFNDRRAIAAALPLELAGQLPLPLEECEIVHLDPVADGGGATVLAGAARRGALIETLALFDAAEIPLQTFDLLPFAIAVGSVALFSDPTLLILSGTHETVLLRLTSGQLLDWRLLPHAGTPSPAVSSALLLQALGSLRSGATDKNEALLLAGIGANSELRDVLRAAGYPVELAQPLLDGQPLAPRNVTAVALALRAGKSGANFRSGAFAQRGAWAALRRQLLLGGMLLFISLLVGASATFLTYHDRSQRAERLKTELVQVYRELVPGSEPVVDPLLQLQGKLVALERSARLGGADRAHAPLAVLAEISRLTPSDLAVGIRDFNWTPDEVHIEGTTRSFDHANRFVQLLAPSPLFGEGRLTDTRALADGKQIEFRLTLPLHSPKEERR